MNPQVLLQGSFVTPYPFMDLDEEELYRLNQEYLQERLKAQTQPEPQQQVAPKTHSRLPSGAFCCAPVIFILGVIALVAFYFSSRAIGSTGDDTAAALDRLNNEVIPKAKEELKKSLDQGENLYNETQGNVKDLTGQYDETKELIDDAQKIYTEIKK